MSGMRVVIDTNVVISGIFWKGNPNKILSAWFKDKFVVLISPEIVIEYEKVIKRMDSGLTPGEIQMWIEIIISHSTTIEAPLMLKVVDADPDDNKFIECALFGHAGYIISGDKHLLDLKEYERIKILSPSQFCTEYSTLF
jgi:putative PIN family toxin of toxin-antitoxin system